MNLSRPDRSARLDALAAQYALGTLSPRARKRLAAIARTDSPVAAAMREWDLRLARLADAVPAVVPAPRVWAGIARRLGLDNADGGRSAARLSLWRGLALAGFALAFALGIALMAPVAERPDERIVVVLADPAAKPALLVSADRGGRFLTVKAVGPLGVPPDRSLELWALPDGRNPHSLGLIQPSGVTRLPLQETAGITLQGTPALAVSLEPAGGSPTGGPTGPVLYSGAVQDLF